MTGHLPNAVVGESVEIEIGGLVADITIRSYEPQPTTVVYKPNRVRVLGSVSSRRHERSFAGDLELSLTEDQWRELNRRFEDGGT